MKSRYPCEAHPLYARWLSMIQRCTNINHKQYANWGGRGIVIADNLRSFKHYSEYVETLPGYDPNHLTKLTLDRKKNSGNYEKGNLRWTCRSTQIANQRPNSRGFNKYTGIGWSKTHKRWIARVDYKKKTYISSVHLTEKAALEARNACIKEHNLPHPIQQYYV